MSSLLLIRLRLVLATLLLVASAFAAGEPVPPPKPEPAPPKFAPGPVVPFRDPAAIISLMERVADFQLAWPDKRPMHHWTRATGYLGLLATSRVSSAPAYEKALMALAERNQWRLGSRIYHADDQVVGQAYLELYEKHRAPRMIAPLREMLELILKTPSTKTMEFGGWKDSDRWCWCDALFMAPQVWGGMARTTGDVRYLDFMIKEWSDAEGFLYDREEKLYHRDSRFFPKREHNGKKIFWGRGNGWVLAAYARMLPYIPENHSARPAIIARYREFAARVVALQPADGLWRSSLLDTGRYTDGETSGSALFCYGLAWGVNNGLLDRAAFAPSALRAWDALAAHVMPDGRLIHVQPVGSNPARFNLDAYEVYGSGALLLAGEQIHKLVTAPTQPVSSPSTGH